MGNRVHAEAISRPWDSTALALIVRKVTPGVTSVSFDAALLRRAKKRSQHPRFACRTAAVDHIQLQPIKFRNLRLQDSSLQYDAVYERPLQVARD